VADLDNKRLTVVDISNPASPVVTGSIQDTTNLNGAQSVYVSGKYAYVAALNGNRLTVVDISGFDIPSANIGNIAANDISVSENLDVRNDIYAGSGLGVGAGGIFSAGGLSIASSVTPQLTVSYNGSNYYTASVSSAGTVSFDATGSSASFNFADNVGIGVTTAQTEALYVSGDLRVTGTGVFGTTTNSARQLNVSMSGAKTTAVYGEYVSNTATSSTASINKYGMYISSTGTWSGSSANNYGLYVDTPTGGTNNYTAAFAGGNVLQTATNPVVKGTINDNTNLSYPYSVYVSGKYAYVATGGSRLTVVDVSNPALPTVVGSIYDTTNLYSPQSVYVSGKYAYVVDNGNMGGNTGHLTVVESETTSLSFAIDLLSSKIVKTWKPIEEKEFEDLFANSVNLSEMTDAEVLGEEIRLFEDVGLGYSAAGSAFSIKIEPQYLAGWKSVSWNDNKPVGTDIFYKIYYEDSASQIVLVPDIDLAGNSAGFQISPIDISSLNTSVYPNIEIASFLSTVDASSTPSVLDWKVVYDEGPTPLGDIPFSMRGNKTIGADGVGAPIYKYLADHQTNPTGELPLNNLEWDNYTITIDGVTTGYDIAQSCLPQPRS